VMREQRDSAQADFKLLAEAFADAYQPRTALDATPAPQEPAGWRLVPLQFIQGVCALAHNYSFTAIPPDYYRGVEGDAFKDAYRRCGRELAKVRAMLTAAPQEPAEPVAPKVYLVAAGEVYEGRETYTRHDVCPPLADAELLYRWLPTYNPDATQPVADAQDARRYRYLESIAYEAVIPHGGKLNGYRTAWITKFVPQPHATFAEAVDAAIDAAMALDVTKRDPNGKE
jgi:hypothetical protein